MSTIKKHQKQDPKEVAAKEGHESEVKYISTHYKISMPVVRKAMRDAGSNGKPSRSRRLIYAKLREAGYVIKTKK